MTGGKWLWLAGVIAVAASVWAVTTTTTTHTTAYLTGVAQRPLTQRPTIDVVPLAGHHLVNLAMGRSAFATNVPYQVLALTIPCDLTTASLVIFDQSTSNTIATIATSLSFDSVFSRVTIASGASQLGTTNEILRFIARLQILPIGSISNALLNGELTVAGRVHRDSVTGCPAPVPVALDVDRYDQTFLDKTVSNGRDKDTASAIARTGLAHVIGKLQLVSEWQTNTVLVPAGNFSIRRDAEILK